MTRARAPFWLIDLVAMLLTGGLAYSGKLATDTFLVVLLAILGFGVSSRAGHTARATDALPPPDDGPQEGDEPPFPPKPARVQSRPQIPPGGVASLAVGIAGFLRGWHA